MEMKVKGMISNKSINEGRNNHMKLIEVILEDENFNETIRRVKSNKGVAGVNKMTIYEIDDYFEAKKERNTNLNQSKKSIYLNRMKKGD